MFVNAVSSDNYKTFPEINEWSIMSSSWWKMSWPIPPYLFSVNIIIKNNFSVEEICIYAGRLLEIRVKVGFTMWFWYL